MKTLLLTVAAIAAATACSPPETKSEAKPEVVVEPPHADPVAPLAPTALAGTWNGTITCYKIESPLTVKIDAATPDKAEVSQGGLTWTATVSVDPAANVVTLKGPQPMADAAVIAGPLSADGKAIAGTMEKQLCTDFTLTRAS